MDENAESKSKAKELGKYLRDLRKDRGMNRPTVENMAKNIHNVEFSANYLYKLETGERDFARAALPVREALRQIYGVTREEFARQTGLHVPGTEVLEAPRPQHFYRVTKPVKGDMLLFPEHNPKLSVDLRFDPENDPGMYLYKLAPGDYVIVNNENPLRPAHGLLGKIILIEFS